MALAGGHCLSSRWLHRRPRLGGQDSVNSSWPSWPTWSLTRTTGKWRADRGFP